jgi:ribosome maturation factor RimP
MILKDKIETLATDFLENTDKFIMNIDVKPGNIIIVTLDGDTLVSIEDCIQLSRYIESKLDRDDEDFELRVRSYGAESPLLLPRQYKKHIGRELKFTLKDGTTLQGKLVEVQDGQIGILEKKGGKKKTVQESQKTLSHNEIEDARIVLSFK